MSNGEAIKDLLQAAGKQSKQEIPEANIYREIGFEGETARLGWVIPPQWPDIEAMLKTFSEITKGRTNIIFSGMGGSINTVKALIEVLGKGKNINLYTIDSLGPEAMDELVNSINDFSKTLVIGISKSGTTKETQDTLKALKEKFKAEGLDFRKHFLWLIDLPNQKKVEDAGWQGVPVIPIQIDKRTDIGGRFTAPHTLIFLLPLFLLLEKNMQRFNGIWDEYLTLREKLISDAENKAWELAKANAQYFAFTLEQGFARALETWITQLIQESLGSKIDGFNPKTVVASRAPSGFSQIEFRINSREPVIKLMLNMCLAQIFTAGFAYQKKINFVIQPQVEIYKKKMQELSAARIPQAEKVNARELVERIKKLIEKNPQAKFIEAVTYWHLQEEEKKQLRDILEKAFPDKYALIFTGSDWNHHSYQAVTGNNDTVFVILVKPDSEVRIKGIPESMLRENNATLKRIAYATYATLEEKAGYFEITGTQR